NLADDGRGRDFRTDVHVRLGVGLGPRVEGADGLTLDFDPLWAGDGGRGGSRGGGQRRGRRGRDRYQLAGRPAAQSELRRAVRQVDFVEIVLAHQLGQLADR